MKTLPGVEAVHGHSEGHQDFKNIIVAPSCREMHTVVSKLVNIFQLQPILEQDIHGRNLALKTSPLQRRGFEDTVDGALHNMAHPVRVQIRLRGPLLEEEPHNVGVSFAGRPD